MRGSDWLADNVTGEQVSYTYDQLNRLVQSASSVQSHSMSFAYDGFGNLTQQGQTSLSIDPATNQITSPGYQYNANGNVIRTPDPATYSYDVANRLVSNGAFYNPRNQRVFDGWYIYLYTPDGKLAGKYQPGWNAGTAYIQGGQPNIYFAGMLILEQGHWVMTDRLGSVRWRDSGERPSYQPYGAEVAPATSDQRTKFATYFRDLPGLDYARQRYYSNVTGRFLTPDPGGFRTANLKNPINWNLYVYASDDPINRVDPSGRDDCGADWLSDASLSGPCYEDGSGGGVVVPDPASLVMIWGAPTITTGERGAYERAMIALLAAAAAAGASASQGGLAYPAYLLVVGDSYTCWGHNVERDVDYQLYDSSNRPTDGTVTETLFATDYGAPVITRPALNQSWGGTNGTFNDTISVQYGPSRQYDQTFSVTGSSESLAGFAAIPVYVKGFGGDYGVLHITKTAQYVDINGNKGSPINCN